MESSGLFSHIDKTEVMRNEDTSSEPVQSPTFSDQDLPHKPQSSQQPPKRDDAE